VRGIKIVIPTHAGIYLKSLIAPKILLNYLALAGSIWPDLSVVKALEMHQNDDESPSSKEIAKQIDETIDAHGGWPKK